MLDSCYKMSTGITELQTIILILLIRTKGSVITYPTQHDSLIKVLTEGININICTFKKM